MGVCRSMMIACVCMCGAEVCGGVGDVEWCECECWMRRWWEYVCVCLRRWCLMCVRCAFGVWYGVRQLEFEYPWCGGWGCDGRRRAAPDVADDIEVRVRLDGVMGVWVWLCE